MTDDEIVEAMAEAIYEDQRLDHDGMPWGVLRHDSWEVARIRADARAALSALPRPSDLEREERAHGETIDQRDAAESALSEAYLIVTGEPPEWSNRFGYREALDDIRGALPRPAVDEGAVAVTDDMVEAALIEWLDCTAEFIEPTVTPVMRERMRQTISAALAAAQSPTHTTGD